MRKEFVEFTGAARELFLFDQREGTKEPDPATSVLIRPRDLESLAVELQRPSPIPLLAGSLSSGDDVSHIWGIHDDNLCRRPCLVQLATVSRPGRFRSSYSSCSQLAHDRATPAGKG